MLLSSVGVSENSACSFSLVYGFRHITSPQKMVTLQISRAMTWLLKGETVLPFTFFLFFLVPSLGFV